MYYTYICILESCMNTFILYYYFGSIQIVLAYLLQQVKLYMYVCMYMYILCTNVLKSIFHGFARSLLLNSCNLMYTCMCLGRTHTYTLVLKKKSG